MTTTQGNDRNGQSGDRPASLQSAQQAADATGIDLIVRSSLPGRVRWEAPRLRGEPVAARLAERTLALTPGVTEIRVSPLTGRILVRHEDVISRPDLEQRVQHAVAAALYAIGGAETAERAIRSRVGLAGPTLMAS